MRRLVCAFVVCIPRRQVFSRRGPYVRFEHTADSSTFPVPELYVREPTDFIPDSEDTSAATSQEVTQANISENNGTAEETKAQQRPKVVSLVCRAH